MAPSVVLDRVAGCRDHLGVLGVLGHVLADLEEGGGHLALLEDREDLWCEGPRPVVEGERNIALAGGPGIAGGLPGVEGRLWALGARHWGHGETEQSCHRST